MTKFRIVLVGRMPQSTRAETEEAIKKGMSLSFTLHDALEDVLIETEPEESVMDLDKVFRRRDDPKP